MIMFVQSICYFFLNIWFENKGYNNINATNQRCNNYIPAKIVDPEVNNEIQSID